MRGVEISLSSFLAEFMLWSELKAQALRLLDQPITLTGSIADAVVVELENVHRSLVINYRPDSMLDEAMKNISSATTTISITSSGGFNVSDLAKVWTLTIDDKQSSERNDLEWKFVSWRSWIRQKNVTTGNIRAARSWTKNPSDEIILSQYPTGTDTWDVYLHYYRTIASYSANEEPELDVNHHQAILYGAVTKFPHFFQGDREKTLIQMNIEYKNAKDDLLRDRDNANQRYVIRTAKRGNSHPVFW